MTMIISRLECAVVLCRLGPVLLPDGSMVIHKSRAVGCSWSQIHRPVASFQRVTVDVHIEPPTEKLPTFAELNHDRPHWRRHDREPFYTRVAGRRRRA